MFHCCREEGIAVMELIRNCYHYGSIYTYLSLDTKGKPEKIIKMTFSQEGLKDLKREAEGLMFYSQKLSLPLERTIHFVVHEPAYGKLECSYFDGEVGNLYLPFRYNRKRILSAVDYYIGKFGQDHFCHGDYSLENIVFREEQVQWVIDWEHFNRQLPCGIDPLYCVLEAFMYAFLHHGVTLQEGSQCGQLLDRIFSFYTFPEEAHRNPFNYLRKIYNEYKVSFGKQFQKFPVVNCDGELIIRLDGMF